MSQYDSRCWQCGRQAPGGVCVGPHPGFRMSTAVSRGLVTGVQAGEVYEGASELASDYYRKNRERMAAYGRKYKRETSRRARMQRRFERRLEAMRHEAQRIAEREEPV